ncbi:rRNA-processing protein SAS10 KNAG_0C03880 [Huiozyma naganishii CBS 8797]|uniref:Sas10 C-terminal domain-containing protein n=1 Tax=Huiozyma naganishii (strain ATCC MYA-139 / BCRC 22969 / CBS 8797 / KCTC 17520 / NBRC 10181 / NCYC 3082 / Yp74L-3) TaxID=1071383 RepID=J7RWV7_HUIN7|nr:hypothetical protein KNAG_0C03880 [Kazachstania naganishii CBS 8797]CCK69492.1 hypothetical protein KNAG_0C03880 [Kazachstania naganishii CBS 8797]
MARHVQEDEGGKYGLSEADDFAAKREKVLLENSSLARNAASSDDDDSLDDLDEEEVMEISEDDEEDDDEEEKERVYRKVFGRSMEKESDGQQPADQMLDNEAAWGDNKNEYYGADDLDDQETAKEIEKEALRQQRKHLQDLNMDDYLDNEIEEEWVKTAKNFDVNFDAEFRSSTKQLGSAVSRKDVLKMDEDSKKEYLATTFPEFSPLCQEFTTLNGTLQSMKSSKQTELVKLKHVALASYLGVISSYFGILLHEFNNNEDFTTMRDHPIMEAILTSKEVWRQASELSDHLESESGSASEQEQVSEEEEVESDLGELDPETLKDIAADVESSDNHSNESSASEAELDDFEEYVTQSRLDKGKKDVTHEDVDDYVESEMADVDAQEKKARRRTLRFYTSKIDQQENKKSDKFAGDDDIPYKERFFERQQRLLEEARKRGMHDSSGADLDDKDYNSEDQELSKSLNSKSTNDYYQQIQKGKENRKQARQDAHKLAVIASREGKLAEVAENVGDDGKRAINYQILKNKGLTPKRNKDNRNSRVKKRKKYDKAQKKLKSVRAVYSGGQSGVYEGEKTGIKKNLTRSVKFKE